MGVRRLEPGQAIDGFRLEAPLKPGGMANLWRVTHPLPLVMKLPFAQLGENPIAIIGFEVEGMILPRLTGEHAPRFVKAGDFSNPYIVMEFIVGTSLKARLDDTPLSADEVAAIGAKVAIALHDLHTQNVIHLDLKPSNVILRESGEAVLIDFGLSRHDQLPDLIAEEVTGPIGTGPYIAPEQVRGDRSDPRSDLFALGVILDFLATASARSASRRARASGAGGCGATPSRRAPGTRTCRRGCRRSSCAASRSIRMRARPPRRNSHSRCAIPSACC
ncbi:MAG: serine/threonine-protein kinase [Alphaproteobacteria bacterium]